VVVSALNGKVPGSQLLDRVDKMVADASKHLVQVLFAV
jgi:hypothetical protein